MFELKVNITDIGSDGCSLDQQLEANFVELTAKDQLHFIKPFDIKAKFELVENGVIVNVDLQGRYESSCYRSLKKVERDLSISFYLDYEIEGNTQYIDIAEEVRQEIILAIPMRVLSDEEIAKDRKDKRGALVASEYESDDGEPKTHKPFEGLKDIE